MVVFVLMVAVSGYALAASGNMENPFTVLTEISTTLNTNGDATLRNVEFGGQETRRNASPPSGFEQQGGERAGEQSTTIQWNMAGGVLFNLWFLAAVTALVMIVGQVWRFVSPQFRGGMGRRGGGAVFTTT